MKQTWLKMFLGTVVLGFLPSFAFAGGHGGFHSASFSAASRGAWHGGGSYRGFSGRSWNRGWSGGNWNRGGWYGGSRNRFSFSFGFYGGGYGFGGGYCAPYYSGNCYSYYAPRAYCYPRYSYAYYDADPLYVAPAPVYPVYVVPTSRYFYRGNCGYYDGCRSSSYFSVGASYYSR